MVILEMLQMFLMVPFSILRQNVNPMGNEAGMDANMALIAEGFLLFGTFNLMFSSGRCFSDVSTGLTLLGFFYVSL